MSHHHKHPSDQNLANSVDQESLSSTDQEVAGGVESEPVVDSVVCPECPEDKLKELEANNVELKDKYLRLQAEWDNYRKRTEQNNSELGEFIRAKDVLTFLPIREDLQRAILSAQNSEQTPAGQALVQGLENILQNFVKILGQYGVAQIETVGKKFDHNYHEALLTGPGPQDVIIQELEAGYTMNGKVIKPARVQVGKEEEKKQKGEE